MDLKYVNKVLIYECFQSFIISLDYLGIYLIFVLLFREEAESLLLDKEEGTFLVRESARRRGEYAVGLK